MQKLLMNKRLTGISIPVIAVFLGFLVGAIIMLLSGYDPILAYTAIFQSVLTSPYFAGETVVRMIPLILAGLSVAFAFKSGLFNIGVEGQLLVGWLCSVYTAIALEGTPKVILLPLCILAGAVAGGLWAFLPGLLKAKLRVHEVIITIMLNYVALHVTNYIIRNFLYVEGERTPYIPENASLHSELLTSLTGSRLHWGFIVSLLAAFIMWFILWKTTRGFELRAVGFNQHASNYAGMSVSGNIILSMVIAGAFAGVAGAMLGLGTFQYMFIAHSFIGIGFDGIAVALLGANTSIGIILASALFSGLKIGAGSMSAVAGVPTELVQIIIALIIFFVASSYFIRWLLERMAKKGDDAS